MAEISEFKAALQRLPPRPWNATIVPPSQFQRQGFTIKPGDDDIGPQGGFEVGTLRSVTGANVVEPWPESASMVIAIPGVLEALASVLSSVEEVIADLELENAALKEQLTEANKPNTLSKPLVSAEVEDIKVTRTAKS
jgi:hypothetical protein